MTKEEERELKVQVIMQTHEIKKLENEILFLEDVIKEQSDNISEKTNLADILGTPFFTITCKK